MKTFDFAEVRGFAAALDARLDRCDNGEGIQFANMDATLRLYAGLCCEYCEEVRDWGRAIFYGRAAFDPEVERIWRDEGLRLYRRASELWNNGRESNGTSFVLEGGAALGSALLQLHQLLAEWVTPKLAAAPLARQGIAVTLSDRADVQKRIDELSPLSADWVPVDSRQLAQFKKLQTQRDPG